MVGVMSASKRFTRDMRLRKKAEFQHTFRQRCSAADDLLVVYASCNQRAFLRIGLCISRRFGAAVKRNRWKRRVREAFRRQIEQLPTGFDFVVLPRKPGGKQTAEAISASLLEVAHGAARRAARRAGRRAENKR
jgi:ribonuclease P protein component